MAKKKLAPAKPLGGFLDVLPEDANAFQDAVAKITAVYRRYGYGPIDLPCIYLYETLAGETGAIDKQLYRWNQGKKDVALRFDLTVPLARYVAANINALSFPFKRFQLGKVWRGESVQKERGRYREFYQLDFDIVGSDCATADLETLLVINDSMEALGLERFEIRLNDRLLLNGVLAALGLEEHGADVLRVIDKLDKVGAEGVQKELSERLGLGAAAIDGILGYTSLKADSNEGLLGQLADRFGENESVMAGIARLRFLTETAAAQVPAGRILIDPSIARGLGYYTGPVFETFLLDRPDVGSVCSGGRYDDLASSYIKRDLPGVGASVGLSRLLAALASLEGESSVSREGCPMLICLQPGVPVAEGVKLRRELHSAGLDCELYPQVPAGFGKPKKAKAQFKYADAKNFRIALILGERELAEGFVAVKNLRSKEQVEAPRGELMATLRGILG